MVEFIIVGAGTVSYVLYLGAGSGTVAPGVLGHNIALAASIWIIVSWLLVAVAWINNLWVVVTDVGILGLICCGVGARTVEPGVSG